MPFCSNCGNEIALGARFCGSCGKEQVISAATCTKCGKTLEENEKFCSGCGTPANVTQKAAPKKNEPKEPRLTKEGRKIIDAGPGSGNKRPTEKSSATKPVQKKNSPRKKKSSSKGCFFRTILILASIVIGAAILIYVVNIFIEDDGDRVPSTQKTTENEESQLTGTNIPGIVDIEPGDVSHLPENRNSDTEQTPAKSLVEGKVMKETAKNVENAFANADTTQIKLLLTETALKTYSGVFKEIQPHMQQYANAFKGRKLISSTGVYKVYEFTDSEGKKFTAEFALQPEGNWKLVRF